LKLNQNKNHHVPTSVFCFSRGDMEINVLKATFFMLKKVSQVHFIACFGNQFYIFSHWNTATGRYSIKLTIATQFSSQGFLTSPLIHVVLFPELQAQCFGMNFWVLVIWQSGIRLLTYLAKSALHIGIEYNRFCGFNLNLTVKKKKHDY
jgi:hypothetical protein